MTVLEKIRSDIKLGIFGHYYVLVDNETNRTLLLQHMFTGEKVWIRDPRPTRFTKEELQAMMLRTLKAKIKNKDLACGDVPW